MVVGFYLRSDYQTNSQSYISPVSRPERADRRSVRVTMKSGVAELEDLQCMLSFGEGKGEVRRLCLNGNQEDETGFQMLVEKQISEWAPQTRELGLIVVFSNLACLTTREVSINEGQPNNIYIAQRQKETGFALLAPVPCGFVLVTSKERPEVDSDG